MTIPEDEEFEATLETSVPKKITASVAEMMRGFNNGKTDWLKDGDVVREGGETEVEATLSGLT